MAEMATPAEGVHVGAAVTDAPVQRSAREEHKRHSVEDASEDSGAASRLESEVVLLAQPVRKVSTDSTGSLGSFRSSRSGSIKQSSPLGRNAVVVGSREEDRDVQDARTFETLVVDKVKDLGECKRLLSRTRAVTLMADRMKLAQEETQCYEEVSKLLVALFGVERSSIALMEDYEHVRIMQMAVSKIDFSKSDMDQFAPENFNFSLTDSGMVLPIEGASFGHLAKTLQPFYIGDARQSEFFDHQKIAGLGLRSVINAPLLIAGKKFLGTLNVGSAEIDAFTSNDQLLIKDVASCLASNVFTLRLQRSQREDAEVNERLLQAMIPGKVLSRIEQYWRDEGDPSLEDNSSTASSEVTQPHRMAEVRAHFDRHFDYVDAIRPSSAERDKASFVQLMRQPSAALSRTESDGEPVEPSAGHALYAEEKKNVSIIFSDIVGFSALCDGLKPIRVMDMLHSLFHRYDCLCERHGVYKVETIGDGCVMAAGLLEESSDHDGGLEAARKALAIAKDMVREARKVPVPRRSRSDPIQFLEIRVGIHVGATTCGVLGKVMPRFQVFGSAVNMAARMEQTSDPGKVQVSKAFHDLIGEDAAPWQDHRTVSVKNMGMQETWLLDPNVG